jgi:hypothetical protein
MTAALIGLVGVILGLTAGRYYTYWATRRAELAEAVVGSAVLADELRGLMRASRSVAGDRSAADQRVEDAWQDYRRWFLLHMSPDASERLTDWVHSRGDQARLPFGLEGLIETFDALFRLFWNEHQAFFLESLVHYIAGKTVSKRIDRIVHRDAPPRATAQTTSG